MLMNDFITEEYAHAGWITKSLRFVTWGGYDIGKVTLRLSSTQANRITPIFLL